MVCHFHSSITFKTTPDVILFIAIIKNKKWN